MAQGSFKKSAGVPRTKGKAGKANTAAKSKRLVNKGKTAVKKGCKWVVITLSYVVLQASGRRPYATISWSQHRSASHDLA